MKRASILRRSKSVAILALCFGIALTSSLHAQDKKKSDKTKSAAKATPTPSAKKSASSDIVLKDPVATVNGQKITKAEFLETVNQQLKAAKAYGIDADALSAEEKLSLYRQILDAMITERLMDMESAAIKVDQKDVDEEVAKLKARFPSEKEYEAMLKQLDQTPDKIGKEIETMLKTKKWIDNTLGDKITVTDEEVKKFYTDNESKFERPERVKASHILFLVPPDASAEDAKKKEDAAKAAIERLKKGEDFAVVAKELSDDPGSKAEGGDLGYFAEGDTLPEFSKAAFSQKVGEVGGPVKTQVGYHVVKATDKQPAGKVSFDEIKDALKDDLKKKKYGEEVSKVIKSLREKADVKINLPEDKAAPAATPAKS